MNDQLCKRQASRVATIGEDETWLLDLSTWSDDVVNSVDGAAALSFQAPNTGCIGNGTGLAPLP